MRKKPPADPKATIEQRAAAAVAKELGFSVRKTGSFLDFPANKKPAHCLSRNGDDLYLGDARPEVVKLWNYAVALKAEEIRLAESEL